MISNPYPAALADLDFGKTWLSLPPQEASVDPFNFEQRMAAYKRIIDDSNVRGAFGAENEFNLFWGYVVQVFWQWHSQRLTLARTPPGRIDPDSVWGYGNYGLSIVPLVGAMRAGITPEIEIVPPYEASKAEYVSGGGSAGTFVVPLGLRKAVDEWEEFFRQAGKLRPGDDLEPLRFKQWHAHHASLSAGAATYERLSPQLSKNEYDFFLGWIRMVDFLGSAAWRTDLDYMLRNGMGVLPNRLLKAEDIPGRIADMDAAVNGNLRNIIGLTRQSQWRFDLNLWMWKRAMRTRQARDEVLPMLDATYNPSPKNASERRKLLRYILKFSGKP
jgi:hypothetical protein